MTDRPSDRAIAQAPNEDALIALFESVYEREWDRAAEESDDRRKAILGRADEHATRMAVRAVVAAAAPDGAQAVVACHRTITENGAAWAWVAGAPSLGALDNLKVHPNWRIEYAYTAPPSPPEASDDMLPAALVPHMKEWYRLCERRFAVERMTISGELAEAIVTALCAKPAPPAQDAEDAVRLAVAVHNATKAYENTRGFYTSESHAAFDDQINRLKAFYAPIIEASNQRKIDAARAAEGDGHG